MTYRKILLVREGSCEGNYVEVRLKKNFENIILSDENQ